MGLFFKYNIYVLNTLTKGNKKQIHKELGLEKTYKYNEEHDLIIEPNLNEIEKEN